MKNKSLAYIIYHNNSVKEFEYPNNMEFDSIAWGMLTVNDLHNLYDSYLNIRNVVSFKEYIEKNQMHNKSDYQCIDKYLANKK